MMDTGYVGYQGKCHAQGTESICKTSYYNHCKFLFKLGEKFYLDNIGKVHDDVKKIYSHCLVESLDYTNGEFLNIIVSLDGAYSQKSSGLHLIV